MKKSTRHIAATLAILGAISLHGCLPSSKVIATKFYTIEPMTLPPATKAEAIPGSRIGIGTFDVANRIGSSLLVRTPDHRVEPMEFHRWAEDPGTMISQLLFLELRQSGTFEEVAQANNVTLPGFFLSGKVLAFEGILPTNPSQPSQAVCRVLLELRSTKDRSLVWSQILESEKEWNNTSSAKTLVAALHDAALDVIHQATNALAHCSYPTP